MPGRAENVSAENRTIGHFLFHCGVRGLARSLGDTPFRGRVFLCLNRAEESHYIARPLQPLFAQVLVDETLPADVQRTHRTLTRSARPWSFGR